MQNQKLLKDLFLAYYKARKNLEILRLYLRICKDLQIISLTKYINISESTENISKQLFSRWKSI